MSKPVRASYCVVVADGARARFFALDPAGPRAGHAALLVEDADLINPAHHHAVGSAAMPAGEGRRAAAGGPGRNDDASDANWRREQDRRFASLVVDKMGELCQARGVNQVVMVADARMLGLLRQKTDRLAGVALHEHSRELTGLQTVAIHHHLAAVGLLPPAGTSSRAMAAR